MRQLILSAAIPALLMGACAGTPVEIGFFDAGDPVTGTGRATRQYKFEESPIQVAAGQAIDGLTVDATTGDIKVQITGWVED